MKDERFGSRGDAAFVAPFRHALNRMQEREFLSPDQYAVNAKGLLIDRLGDTGKEIRTGFAYGAVGVQADHTIYFNGFALLKSMHQGAAVACRASEDSSLRFVFEGVSKTYLFELPAVADDTDPLVVRTLCSLSEPFLASGKHGLELAVVNTVPVNLETVFLSTVSTAALNAIESLRPKHESESDQVGFVQASIQEVIQSPMSPAFIIGARDRMPDSFVLVDTDTFEHVALDSPAMSAPDWALVATGRGGTVSDRRHRVQMVQEIISRLREKRFPSLQTLRDLEHRDLETAMGVVPRRLRPALRSLVSENRRVQRMVAAIRQEDWQLLGAHLFMSHTSRKDDWMATSAMQDFVVEAAERFSLEGVYGAARTGEGPFVLVAGQPFRIPAFLDYLRNHWPDQATEGPETLTL